MAATRFRDRLRSPLPACLPAAVANRVLSVGSAGRAERASKHMDSVTVVGSSRGFTTYTGLYKGVPVSIVATGMGTAMMDFVVRETRAVVTGEMAMLRFGTCGGLGSTGAGNVVVAADSVLVRREPDAFRKGATDVKPYSISAPVQADAGITEAYVAALEARVAAVKPVGEGGPYAVVQGTDVTCDSFYSSQGRQVEAFGDANTGLLDTIEAEVPGAACAQMETFQLLDLATCAAVPIKAGGAALSMSNRATGATVDMADFSALEMAGCLAALDALAATEVEGAMSGPDCVWHSE